MALRPVGITSFQTNAAATAFPQVELDGGGHTNLTEFGITHDGAPNDTNNPPEWLLRRKSAGGANGTSQTPEKVNSLVSTTLLTASKVHGGTAFTSQGTVDDILHRMYVPIVSGTIWVAAPGREIDFNASGFLDLANNAALPTGRRANVYMVFEE